MRETNVLGDLCSPTVSPRAQTGLLSPAPACLSSARHTHWSVSSQLSQQLWFSLQPSPVEQPSLGWPHSSAQLRVLHRALGTHPSAPDSPKGTESAGVRNGSQPPPQPHCWTWHKEMETSENQGLLVSSPDLHHRQPAAPQCQPLSPRSRNRAACPK